MLETNFFIGFIIIFLIVIIIVQQMANIRAKNKASMMEKTKELLYEVGEKVSKSQNKQEVYGVVLDAAIEAIPYSTKGSILVVEEDGYFHYVALRGYSNNIKEIYFKREEIFLCKVNNFSDITIIHNPCKFDEEVIEKEKIKQLKDCECLNITCTLSSPIYIDSKLIGIINIDTDEVNRIFNDEDIKIMRHIKNELELALKNFFVNDKLRYLANFDELTGIYNRRYLEHSLSNELKKVRTYRREACLVLIDLDDFKSVNDNYGHSMGDKVLKFFSQVLSDNIDKNNIYGRMSGDEFVIFFVNCDKKHAITQMENIKNALKADIDFNFKINFSYGICPIEPHEKVHLNEVFGIADKNMYIDKGYKIQH